MSVNTDMPLTRGIPMSNIRTAGDSFFTASSASCPSRAEWVFRPALASMGTRSEWIIGSSSAITTSGLELSSTGVEATGAAGFWPIMRRSRRHQQDGFLENGLRQYRFPGLDAFFGAGVQNDEIMSAEGLRAKALRQRSQVAG